MPTTETSVGSERSVSDLLAVVVLVAGIGLVGIGSYVHLTVAARASAGRCDG